MKDTNWDVTPSPFVFAGFQLTVSSVILILSLAVQIVLMIFFADIRALSVILASVAGALLAEFCFRSAGIDGAHRRFSDGTAVCAGLLAGFVFPTAVFPVLAAAATFFGIFIARNFFNGKGNAWIHSAALAAVFVYISSPESFSALADTQSVLPQTDFDSELTRILNTYCLRPMGINLPGGYVSMFFNPAAPVPALKFGILTLAVSAFLIAVDVIDWLLPCVCIAVYSAAVFFFPFPWTQPPASPAVFSGDIFFNLLSNGIFFVAFYLLSDVSSMPRTKPGRITAGILAGLTAFLFCGYNGSPVGSVLTVLAVNAVSPLIESVENRALGIAATEADR